MYAQEIEALLRSNDVTRASFIGVFSCDCLPQTTEKIFSLVVNTDTSNKPGRHWQVIHVENGQASFFCSLGNQMNKHVREYLTKYKHIQSNARAAQRANETTCGGYCVLVIFLLASGHTFENVCKLFDVLPHDDLIVRAFMSEYLNFNLPKCDSFIH